MVTHQFDDIEKKDELRQTRLEQIGFKVLRFQDGEILNNIGDVIRTIENFINQES